MMRAIRLAAAAVAVALLSASPVSAAGSFVTKTVQNEFGNTVPMTLYDESGVGLGPFDRTSVCTDGSGKICASGTNSSPTVVTGLQGPASYGGGKITTGGVSQQLFAANTSRHGWNFQNQSTGFCYLKIGGLATTDNVSLRIGPNAIYETPTSHTSTAAINVTCVDTAAAFYATEW